MVRKIGIATIVLGIAAFSPAPINDARVKVPRKPEQTQDQVSKQQALNGVVPIVGQVPTKTNEVGMQEVRNLPQGNDSSGEQSMVLGTAKADKVGGNSITQASRRVQDEGHSSKFLWIYGLLIAGAGFGGWKAFQYKIEQSTPVPEFSGRLLKNIKDGKI